MTERREPYFGIKQAILRYEGRFKPYVRMTQRSKYVNPEAKEYLSSKVAMALAFKQQISHPFGRVPLAVNISITHAGGFHNRDLDNEIKAIFDACNGVVWEDDRWVDRVTASRKRGEQELIELDVWKA